MKPERNELKGKVPTSTQYANWKMPKKGQSRRGGKRGGGARGNATSLSVVDWNQKRTTRTHPDTDTSTCEKDVEKVRINDLEGL